MNVTQARADFRALHASGCFILPNPWDIGSARRLEKLGFRALASSSAAAAWNLGKDDYELEADDVIAHLETLVGATSLPVNADFENGFSDDPATIAGNVARAVGVGVAALSIEDRSGNGLRDEAHALECLRAAKAACSDAMLVARTEAWLVGIDNASFAIDRLVKFADAGADVLYAPGVRDVAVIADIVRAVAPLPVNVLRMGPDMDLKAIAATGVRRISTGGALAAAAWAGFDKLAGELRGVLD